MYKNKSLLATVLVVIMLLVAVLTGCGGGAAPAASGAAPAASAAGDAPLESSKDILNYTPPPAASVEPAASVDPAASVEPAASQDAAAAGQEPVVDYKPRTDKLDTDVEGATTKNGKAMIGHVTQLTGTEAYGSNEVKYSAEMACKEQGTLYGKPIEYMSGDGKDQASIISEYERLKAAGCKVFLGSYDINCDLAISKLVDKDKCLLFSTCSWDHEMMSFGIKNLFQVTPSVNKFGDELAGTIIAMSEKFLNIKKEDLKVAVIWNAMVQYVSEPIRKGLRDRGVTPVYEEGYPYERKDYTPLVTKLMEVKPDVLTPCQNSADGPQFRKKMLEMKYEPTLYLASGMIYDQPDFQKLGGEVTDGICTQAYTTPLINTDCAPGLKEFKKNFEEYAGHTPLTHALQGYSGVKVILRELDKIGEKPIEEIVPELRKVDIAPGMTPAYWGCKWDDAGRNTRAGEPHIIAQWQKNELMTIYPEFMKTAEPQIPYKK